MVWVTKAWNPTWNLRVWILALTYSSTPSSLNFLVRENHGNNDSICLKRFPWGWDELLFVEDSHVERHLWLHQLGWAGLHYSNKKNLPNLSSLERQRFLFTYTRSPSGIGWVLLGIFSPETRLTRQIPTDVWSVVKAEGRRGWLNRALILKTFNQTCKWLPLSFN